MNQVRLVVGGCSLGQGIVLVVGIHIYDIFQLRSLIVNALTSTIIIRSNKSVIVLICLSHLNMAVIVVVEAISSL